MRSRTTRRVAGLFLLVVCPVAVVVVWVPSPASAQADYCAALPESAGVVSRTPGVGCVGRLPGTATGGIFVEILDVGSPAAADARARSLVDALAEPVGCTPYQFTDGTLTEAFDCSIALSVLEAGDVVVSATTTVPAGTLDGQPWWSETTAAVRLVGNRLGLVDDVDEGAAQPPDPGPATQQTPPQDVAGSENDDSAPVGAVAAGAAGAAVITGVLVGRTVQNRRRRSGGDADATADPCAELGAMADALNSDFRALEPLRVELWRTWDRWHELSYRRTALMEEIDAAWRSAKRGGFGNTLATGIGGIVGVGSTYAGQTVKSRVAQQAIGHMGGATGVGTAVVGEHAEWSRQEALQRIGRVRVQVELLDEDRARVNATAQDLIAEISDRVDELRRRAIDYRDHPSRGCPKPPVRLDLLDRNWFDAYTPPRPPVAEPETDGGSRETGGQAEIDCAALGDALAEYRRVCDRVEHALRTDSEDGVTLGAQLLVLEQFERRVASYRSGIERTIGDIQMSRTRWSGTSMAIGAIAVLPVASAVPALTAGAALTGGSAATSVLATLASGSAAVVASRMSPTDADLFLVGRLRQVESRIADVRNRLRDRRMQLAVTSDVALDELESEHARLLRAAYRCPGDFDIPEPPSPSGHEFGAEARRARSILRLAERDVARLAFPGDVGLAAWIDIMLKETAQW